MKKTIISIILLILSKTYANDLDFLAKKILSKEDTKLLEKNYLVYSASYERENLVELTKAFPLIRTNAHHHILQYLLTKELRDHSLRGLPLLHIDSHSDMGFLPSHYKHLNSFLKSDGILKELSQEKISSFQKMLTDVSQVIVPALISELTAEIHMCIPPWYKRVNKFNQILLFDILLFNKESFVNERTHRLYPVTNLLDDFSNSPFIHLDKKINPRFQMTFYKCFEGPKLKINSNYILSLDLDIFSTNGDLNHPARPISDFRTQNNEISEKEFSEFKNRLALIQEILAANAKKGFRPQIATISDSTLNEGGDFTPPALAYLANLYFTQFFKELN